MFSGKIPPLKLWQNIKIVMAYAWKTLQWSGSLYESLITEPLINIPQPTLAVLQTLTGLRLTGVSLVLCFISISERSQLGLANIDLVQVDTSGLVSRTAVYSCIPLQLHWYMNSYFVPQILWIRINSLLQVFTIVSHYYYL